MTMLKNFLFKQVMRQNSLSRFLRQGDDGVTGVAAIEFGIIAPTLALMLVCTADLGLGFYQQMQVQNAAQAGAQYAIGHTFSSDSITNAVTNATMLSGITASPGPAQFCGCPSSTGITTATCNTTCSDGSVTGTYVAVSAQATYTTLLPYPGLPNSFTLTATSTVRTQ